MQSISFGPKIIIVCMISIFRAEGAKKIEWGECPKTIRYCMSEWKDRPAAGGIFFGFHTPNQCKKHVFHPSTSLISENFSASRPGQMEARFAHVRFFFVFQISGGEGGDVRTQMSTVGALRVEQGSGVCCILEIVSSLAISQIWPNRGLQNPYKTSGFWKVFHISETRIKQVVFAWYFREIQEKACKTLTKQAVFATWARHPEIPL